MTYISETSQQKLMALPSFPTQLTCILEEKYRGKGRLLRTSCLDLLHETSLSEGGRGALVEHFDMHRYLFHVHHYHV